MSSLIDAFLNVPAEKSRPAEQPALPLTPKVKVELTDAKAEVEVRDPELDVDRNSLARAALANAGLDPDEWRVTRYRTSEWTMPGGGEGVSRRFSFERGPSPEIVAAEIQQDVAEILSSIDWNIALPVLPTGNTGTIVAIGDMQAGKFDGGDTLEGFITRVKGLIDQAAVRIGFDDEITIAWLGDHVEGFTSQGGANAWRTKLTLTEQTRVVRRLMMYAVKVFVPRCNHLRVVAVPGNHGEPQRFSGTGLTRYDDSHDTEALVVVSEVCQEHEDARLQSVEFIVPSTDELTVAFETANLPVLCAHGHKWRPGKHFDWWKGQAFGGFAGAARLLLAGHLHHLLMEMDGDRLFVQVPATELESTWFRHIKGAPGSPGLVVIRVLSGAVQRVELVTA